MSQLTTQTKNHRFILGNFYELLIPDTVFCTITIYHDKIDKALNNWMQESEKNTKELIEKHWNKIEALANELLKKEVIYEEEIDKILG